MRYTLDLSHHAWLRGEGQAARTLETARAADAAGIDVIWATEDPEGWDAFAILSAIATVTRRAELGSGVINPYSRHPNLLAASIATLDHLSGGRAILGIGRGQVEWHRDALGAETGSPLAVLSEVITLIQQWWMPPHQARAPVGGYFAVRDWERVIHPTRRSVPIYLAASGPLALDLAGEKCDGVIFNLLTSDEGLRWAIPRVRAAAGAAGRDTNALAFVLRTSIVVIENAKAERRAIDRAKTLFALIAPLPGMGSLLTTTGFDVTAIIEEISAAMRTKEILAVGGGFPALRRGGGLSAARAAIPDDLIRQLGIIGTISEVRERVRHLETLGVTHVGVTPPREAISAEDWRLLLGDLRE